MEYQDRSRLKSFMRWHLLPFILVVLVYAVLENWWIYYKLGGQTLLPYFCFSTYNMLLIVSFILFSCKKSMIRDFLNMALTYFFPFAVEIFNTVCMTERDIKFKLFTAGIDYILEYKIRDSQYRLGILLVGWAFFFYAVFLRSKLLNIHSYNNKEGSPLIKKSNSMSIRCTRTHLIIFAISLMAKSCFELFWIYTIVELKYFPTFYVVTNNIHLLISTALYYCFRNPAYDILNIVIAYRPLLVLQHINFKLKINITIIPSDIGLMSMKVLDNCVLLIVGGLFFVFSRTIFMLLEDYDYSASAQRLFDYLKFKFASAKQPSQSILIAGKEKYCEKCLKLLSSHYDSF